jgi:hypothetical protein
MATRGWSSQGRSQVRPCALRRRRHRRQPGRPGAAQRLQQHGLGLVAPVVGQQHEAQPAARAMPASAA